MTFKAVRGQQLGVDMDRRSPLYLNLSYNPGFPFDPAMPFLIDQCRLAISPALVTTV